MSQNDPNPDLNLDAQDTAPVAELSEVEALRAELNKLREDSLRERAELDNQRKRVARDIDMARKFANERLLSDLLPVILIVGVFVGLMIWAQQQARKRLDLAERHARIDQFELAYRMQISVPEVMDISRESQATLDMYGAKPGGNGFANNCLLARRLVEQGVAHAVLALNAVQSSGNADAFYVRPIRKPTMTRSRSTSSRIATRGRFPQRSNPCFSKSPRLARLCPKMKPSSVLTP